MTDDRGPARLAKWPFYLADLLLSAVIIFVLYQLGRFEGTTEMVIVTACIFAAAIAAWISIIPWLKEHEGNVQLADSANLKSSLEQIKGVEKIADLIRQSNAQWQSVQETSARTVASARDITDRMKAEADEFMKFISQAHDQERAGLRLEAEKLRRMEGDWIKVAVQMLDHIYALTRAGERSGQTQLIKQLHQFQGACRDVARRMGLATFVPALGEDFDQRLHQLPNPEMTAQAGDKVQDVLASGFTYQGQLLRRSLVLLEGSEPAAAQDQNMENHEKADARASEGSHVDEPSAEPEQIMEEPVAVIDSGAEEMKQELESTGQPAEEPPAIIDTYSPPGEDERAGSDSESEQRMETDPEIATTEPASRPPREKKRSGQEELPF